MTELWIPRTPSDITTNWLSWALCTTGAIQQSNVTDVSAETIPVGEGFTSELARLNLVYESPDDNDPVSMIAKFPSKYRPTRSLLNRLGVYEREVRFYQKLASGLPLNAPRPYFTVWNNQSQESLLLLEDLSCLRVVDQLIGCAQEDAQLAVNDLARFHANFWNSAGLADMSWAPRWDMGAEIFQTTYPILWRRLLQNMAESLPPAMSDLGEIIGPHITAIKRRLARPPATLVHGDFRLDNMFFNSQTRRISVVDWQGVRLGRGTYDLAYFTATSLTSNMRRRWQDKLIGLYHDKLLEYGVTGYTLEECHEDHSYSLLDMLSFVTLVVATFDFKNERRTQIAIAIVRRLADALAEVDAERLLAVLQEESYVESGYTKTPSIS
ncbi:ecdysteroid 22-kinase family protein [Dehalococcoidia bacterium]|nr:ecdysteroid 22-kinase family protein [Dehalococcoidia bacterium]